MSSLNRPLTVGTSGHVDHGKTTLVAALTGVDTDRLPQERERGLSIELGFAPLELSSGRRVSLVDVPGHERFVRTMVAGASGFDFFLLVVAADDGVMPQTREHVRILRALDITRGVVAVTKTDVADPARAAAEVRELVGPEAEIVSCCGPSRVGVESVREALARVADRLTSRAETAGPALLHVDRVFTVRGAGTVVTGTLWAGNLGAGDRVTIMPSGEGARVRAVHVHDAAVTRAAAGQRVAVNLASVPSGDVTRGMVLTGAGSGLRPAWILDVALDADPSSLPRRAHVHHGTRETAAKVIHRGDSLWQIRCREPLLARRGDRVVVRSEDKVETLGGGAVVDPRARRRGSGQVTVRRPARMASGAEPETRDSTTRTTGAPSVGARLPPEALALERRLRAAGHEPPRDRELDGDAAYLPLLRAAGRAVRLGPSMHAHPDCLAGIRARVAELLAEEGELTLSRLRDELGTSRKYAQALLDHCDAHRLTLRLPDDRRVERRRTKRA